MSPQPMMGAIIVLNRVFAVVVEMKGLISDCIPMRCDIGLLMQSTCFFQFREGSNQRPRYVKQLTCSRGSPLISLSSPSRFDRCCSVLKSIVLASVAFIVNMLILCHWLTLSKSSLNCIWICFTHFPETKNAVSSAYRIT